MTFPDDLPAEPTILVVLVGGLDQHLINESADTVIAARPGWSLRYRVVADGEQPILTRARVRDGICIDQTPLATGSNCLACVVRDDVLDHLREWQPDPDARAVNVILPSGADPACLVDPIDLSFLALLESERHGAGVSTNTEEAPRAQVTAVIVAVDGQRLLDQATSADDVARSGIALGAFEPGLMAELTLKTLRYADVLLVNGPGSGQDAQTRQVLELAAHIAPHATVAPFPSQPLLAAAISVSGHDPTRTHASHESLATRQVGRPPAHGVATSVWTSRRPMHPERLKEAMGALTEEATSIEGPLWIASRPHEVLRLAIAGSRASLTAVDFWLANAPEHAWDNITRWRRIRTQRSWDPYYGDRLCSLVILTVDPGSAHRVHQTLEFAALNDTELGAGFEAWALLEDPFTALLGDPATAHP